MINQMLKWGALLAIWKKYGRAIKLLPLILFFVVLVYALHSDYLEYAEVSNKKELVAWSFLIKWCAILSICLAYWLYIKAVLKPAHPPSIKARMQATAEHVKEEQTKPYNAKTDSKKTKASKESASSCNTGKQTASASTINSEDRDDPFDSIRKRKTLRSKADFIVAEKNKDTVKEQGRERR